MVYVGGIFEKVAAFLPQRGARFNTEAQREEPDLFTTEAQRNRGVKLKRNRGVKLNMSSEKVLF
jgi:hypothetical protein